MNEIRAKNKVCVVCGREYMRTPEWPAIKTCSKECQNKWHSQRSTAYRKKNWDKLKKCNANSKRERDRKAREPLFQDMARMWIDQYKKLSPILEEDKTAKGLAEYIGEQMSHTVVLRPKYIKQIKGE